MFDGIVVKIVSSKKQIQMIMRYFVTDTLALAEQYHHPRTWCCPMPQNFVTIQSTKYGLKHTVSDMYVCNTYDLKNMMR